MIRKTLLQIGGPAVLVFMAWNAYLGVNHSKQMQSIVAHTLESSTIQAQISSVLKDLTDMETAQRGYLLTADPSYLLPYTDAKARIGTDLADLRAGLANRAESERSKESQLESLARSKQAEIERSIGLRQQGYRHRSFMLVSSNEGMEYMDRARGLLSSLSTAETKNFDRLDKERTTSSSKALVETIVANLCLVVMTACLFALFRYHGKVLEQETAKSKQERADRDLQLEKMTFALANQARLKTSAIEVNARLLLDNYGGFLPRRGHEYAEQIREASIQMERLRQDLVASPGPNSDERVA